MLIEPQELYNYAVTDGVTCTSAEMIDGDVKTRGYADGRWIHLNLPTRKAIHRITIRGTNIINAMNIPEVRRRRTLGGNSAGSEQPESGH